MTLKVEQYESSAEPSEPTGPREQREYIKLKVGERFRNMVMNETRTHDGDYGVSILTFMDDATDPDGKYIFGIKLKNEEGKQGVFDRMCVETFLFQNEDEGEDGYWYVKEAFIDRPVWIGKVAVQGNKGRTYNKLEWGYEGTEKVVRAPSEPKNDDGGPVDNKLLPEVNTLLVKAVTEKKNVFQAAQLLKEAFDEPADKAIEIANAYYSKKGLL